MRPRLTQKEFEDSTLFRLPDDLKRYLLEQAIERTTVVGRQPSNLWLATVADDIHRQLGGMSFEIANSDSALRERAADLAERCCRSPTLDAMRKVAIAHGVTPPDACKHTRTGQSRRLTCQRWWRSKLRRQCARNTEEELRKHGLVRQGRCVYVSDESLRRRQRQKANLARSIDASTLTNDNGDTLELSLAVDSSLSNPKNRRAELMTRVRGLEKLGIELEHAAVFFTLTTPSAYHAYLEKGRANPRFQNKSVREAMAWLNQKWQRARAAIGRRGILVYGLRVAEPHHDGTPHFHVLLFCPPTSRQSVEDILRHYWLQDDGSDIGAAEHRVQAKDIDFSRGSAVGYISKYIAKNIDGFKVGDDFEAEADATATVERVEAWASTHCIRQFQQIGGPATAVWRELRRIRKPITHREIETAREAANDSDYAEFVRRLGGISLGRKTEMRLWKEQTGELNDYDEVRGSIVVGVSVQALRWRTRATNWRVLWNSKASALFGSFPPWTRSNNCTAATRG